MNVWNDLPLVDLLNIRTNSLREICFGGGGTEPLKYVYEAPLRICTLLYTV